MTELLEKAIEMARKASPEQQDMVAQLLIDSMQADKKWDELLADPRSKTALSKLADEARREIAQGKVYDYDPSNRPK